jgi:hypothetical protein
MKATVKRILILAVVLCFTGMLQAQTASDTTSVLHKVIKQNGVAFVGKILSQDAREVLLETKEVGLVYIPKHEIKEILPIISSERAVTGGLFSTRYFLTTNGFSIKKGDNYVQWNLFGPDFQFGIADNFGVGIMTSWVGMPIIGTAKYSVKLGKNVCGGLGFLGGTGSWAFPQYGLVLPFGFLTFGDRMNNLNVSAGYGGLFTENTEYTYTITSSNNEWETNGYTSTQNTYNDAEGRPLFSVAGMFRLNSKFSFVFDSFIMVGGRDRTVQNLVTNWDENTKRTTYSIEDQIIKSKPLIVLAPGLRFQATENSSFQFGFTGVHVDGEFVPVPIPMVQWFRKI